MKGRLALGMLISNEQRLDRSGARNPGIVVERIKGETNAAFGGGACVSPSGPRNRQPVHCALEV